MLYKILLICVCLVGSFVTSGQPALSVAAGVNLNSIRLGETPSGSNLQEAIEVRAGFHVGIFRSFELGKQIQLSPGLQYSQKGCNAGDFFPPIILHYIEVPVLVSWSPVERFAIDAGPTLAYNIGAYEKLGNTRNKFTASKFDFGMNAGASFRILPSASIYGRYYFGLVSFDEIAFRDENNIIHYRTPQYNTTIQFGVRYHFGKSPSRKS